MLMVSGYVWLVWLVFLSFSMVFLAIFSIVHPFKLLLHHDYTTQEYKWVPVRAVGDLNVKAKSAFW